MITFIGQNDYAFRDTPSATLDLKAAIVSSRFVTLSWSPPKKSKEPLNGYSIYYKQDGSDRERVVNSTRGNLEEINIQGKYRLTLKAFLQIVCSWGIWSVFHWNQEIVYASFDIGPEISL